MPTSLGHLFGNMTAEVTVKNNGSEIVGVSAFEFKFFLFDAKNASVYLLTWDEPPGPDASPSAAWRIEDVSDQVPRHVRESLNGEAISTGDGRLRHGGTFHLQVPAEGRGVVMVGGESTTSGVMPLVVLA